MCSIVNQNNLNKGISKWREKNWPKDFHNEFYSSLNELIIHGINQDNWKIIVDHLSKWKANRPKSNDFIYKRGLERLTPFNGFIHQINLTIETASWTDIEPIFSASQSIKNVNSPVFASKLSHFIFPKLFPVVDREVIGLEFKAYNNYWSFIKKNWDDSAEKDSCIERLDYEIGENIFEHYPWPTKITELCLIGFNSI